MSALSTCELESLLLRASRMLPPINGLTTLDLAVKIQPPMPPSEFEQILLFVQTSSFVTSAMGCGGQPDALLCTPRPRFTSRRMAAPTTHTPGARRCGRGPPTSGKRLSRERGTRVSSHVNTATATGTPPASPGPATGGVGEGFSSARRRPGRPKPASWCHRDRRAEAAGAFRAVAAPPTAHGQRDRWSSACEACRARSLCAAGVVSAPWRLLVP